MPDTLWGRVTRVVYNSDDFYILNLDVADSDPPVAKAVETARGSLYGLLQVRAGVPLVLEGEWKRHQKYGRQFTIRSWRPWADSATDVEVFLSTCIDGFYDRRVASILAAELGPEVFDRLTDAPGELQANPPGDLTSEELEEVLLGWERMLATRNLAGLLKAGGLTGTDVQTAIRKFGLDAPKVIQENPYRLMEIYGFSFPKVDKLAESLGVGHNDPRRLEGAILWMIHDGGTQGHLYMRRGDLTRNSMDLLFAHGLKAIAARSSDYEAAIQRMVDRGALVLEENLGVYTLDAYEFERRSAAILAELIKPSTIEIDPEPFLKDYERTNQIELSEAQRQAVESLKEHRVLVLTGLPGTGKTTAVRALVRFFEEARIGFALMAPTGIAAKRLASVTGHSASTIHRALHFDGTTWRYGSHNRYVVDAVIVDEMSMVDQELLYRLLVALRPDTMLVLVGDDAQLPSVGPGNVLRELVACPDTPNVRLTQIFRQSEKGDIVVNSHRINRGEMPILVDPKTETEFKFIRMSDEERIVETIVKMAARLKSRDANFQVLSPKYDGVTGVNNLNERLRDELNPPGPKEWKRGNLHFRLGDRLMVVRNDYKRSVYNGDVGKLVRIDHDGLVVKIHDVGEQGFDMEVEFTDAAAEDKLRLAYAVTVHKSQGSEFDTILMPIVRAHGRMLQRNLLYTAVTRARKRVWLLGDESAIRKAIDNNQVIKRNTALSKAVSDAVASGVEPGGHERSEEAPGSPDRGAESTPQPA